MAVARELLTNGVVAGRSAWGLDDPDDPESRLDLLDPPAWHADAACHEHPEVNFVPVLGESTAPAKAVCGGCLVADQ